MGRPELQPDTPRLHTTAADTLRVRSGGEVWLLALGAGAAIAAFDVGAQWFVYIYLLHQAEMHFIGCAIAGLTTILLVERLLERSNRATQATIRRLETIAAMNHHIRNALQTISYERHFATDAGTAARMSDAVRRIQWALEEVLPGVSEQEVKSKVHPLRRRTS
ncbi:MAG: hypothetical protein ACR2IF_03275 [Terriglobales bacterium]